MKKIFLTILLFSSMMFLNAQDMIKLPAPNRQGGLPLNEAFSARASTREFASQPLSQQQLSDLLWAANGVNRENGKRTAPSARNCQEIDVYVFTSDAAYLYEAKDNVLIMKKKGDFRKEIVTQPFAAEAPAILIFVANYDKMQMDDEGKAFYGATDAGFVSQNVYLHCASQKMNTVVLGSIYRDELQKMLGFNGKAILGQPVGFAK